MHKVIKIILFFLIVNSLNIKFAAAEEKDLYMIGFMGAKISRNIEMKPIFDADDDQNTINNTNTLFDHHLSSSPVPFLEIGLGHYILDCFRADISFTHYFNTKYKKSGRKNLITDDDEKFSTNVVHKNVLKLDTVMVNAYVDLLSLEYFTIYSGVGFGIAQLKSRFNSFIGPDNNKLTSDISKKNINCIYALHLGLSKNLTSKVHAMIQYSWKDFGKTKKFKDTEGGDTSFKGFAVRGHNISAGLRIDI